MSRSSLIRKYFIFILTQCGYNIRQSTCWCTRWKSRSKLFSQVISRSFYTWRQDVNIMNEIWRHKITKSTFPTILISKFYQASQADFINKHHYLELTLSPLFILRNIFISAFTRRHEIPMQQQPCARNQSIRNH